VRAGARFAPSSSSRGRGPTWSRHG
jgi:hypothetical protein